MTRTPLEALGAGDSPREDDLTKLSDAIGWACVKLSWASPLGRHPPPHQELHTMPCPPHIPKQPGCSKCGQG